MTSRERQLLGIRFLEIENELTALSEGRVVDGSPAEVEERLLDEQEKIEFRLGEADFEEREINRRFLSQLRRRITGSPPSRLC